MSSTKPEAEPPKPPPIALWWEAQPVWKQLAISVPPLSVLFFVLNIGAFGQPLLRSVFYGLFEGGVFAGLFAAVTAGEKGKRTKK
jgi:hypothetical protein